MAIAGKRELYFGVSDGETFNFQEGLYTDDGTPIASRVRTKEYYLSSPDQIDEIQRIFAYADEPQGGNLSIALDSKDYEYLGSMQKISEPQKFDIWENCFHISVGIDEISSNNFKIKGFNIHYLPQSEII